MTLSLFEATNADGYPLVGEVSGGGDDVLVALHGGPGGGTEYLLPIHQLARPDRRVVTFDQLGTARSGVPAADYPWSQQRAAADVDAVRRHVGADRVAVFGHSWGGTLALQYALDFAERVDRLVLSSAAYSTASVTMACLRQLDDLLPASTAAAAITADALGEHDDPAFRAAVSAWLARYLSDGSGEPAPELDAEALAPDPGGLGLWGRRLWFADGAARGWDVQAELGNITAPALVIHGGRDAADTEVTRPLVDGLGNATWVTMSRAGHDILNGAESATYLSVIDAFLRGNATAELLPARGLPADAHEPGDPHP